MDETTIAAAMAAVDEGRQWSRLEAFGRLGAIPGGGVNRPCLSPLDREARRLLIGWAEAAGASASIDAANNLWLRRPGHNEAASPVLTGSHMDTQPAGGRFDGMYGVLAGLEMLTALADQKVVTDRPIEVVAWTNEEGSRFAPGCMGSMAWSGARSIESFADIRDADGIRFGDALREQMAAEADLPMRPLGHKPHAYIEAHIEQGPLLEAAGLDIGLVTGIQGSRWFNVTIQGESAHAGTTPLALRRDAVQGMVRAISALNQLMADPEDVLRFTVGRMGVVPNSSNSVAAEVRFSIDLRHPEAAVLTERGDAIAATIRAAASPLEAEVAETFHAAPAEFAPMVLDTIEAVAKRAGFSHRRLASGAFHDAQFVVPVCPTGMIFIPSRSGISHNPAEYSSPQQLAAGTRVLVGSILGLSGQNPH
jgi:N-carbamoyl-L-amino-acid hydrolase